MKRQWHRFTIAVGCAALPVIAAAHHSNAEYDRGTVTEFDGEIVAVVWRNPHVGLTVRTVDADGRVRDWKMEAADLLSTLRRGVPEGTFQAGQQVKVAGHPSTRRENRMLVTNVLLPSGVEVLLTRAELRWSDRHLGGGDWVRAAPVASAVARPDIFRVWTLESTRVPEFTEDPPLTPAARAAHAAWDSFDDPALDCVSIGMPRVMTRTGPHPIEFARRGDDILIRGEYFDTERLVRMNGAADPARAPATPLGFSVGHWDGGELVVETTRIDWPYFDIRGLEGVPQSEQVRIVERFKLSEDGSALSYDISISDPATFTRPVEAHDYAVWRWRPSVELLPYECEP